MKSTLFFTLALQLTLTTAWKPTIRDAAPHVPIPPEPLRHAKFGVPKIPELPTSHNSKMTRRAVPISLTGLGVQHMTPAKLKAREL